jgi:hypothetical protein
MKNKKCAQVHGRVTITTERECGVPGFLRQRGHHGGYLRRPCWPRTCVASAILLVSGRTFLIIGDVTAARWAFYRAAESGDAQAALALGGTFDPLVLKIIGAVGSRPIRPTRGAGTKKRRSSGRGMRRSGSMSSPNRSACDE